MSITPVSVIQYPFALANVGEAGADFTCSAVRTPDNEIYVKLKDISLYLGYKNVKKAYALLDKRWLTTWRELEVKMGFPKGRLIVPSNWQGGTKMASEAAVYSLLFRSKKPLAKTFRHYVCETVLPSIRKNGYYVSPNITPQQNHMLLKQILINKQCSTKVRNVLHEPVEIETQTQTAIAHVIRGSKTKPCL